jgi:hypothetical protein
MGADLRRTLCCSVVTLNCLLRASSHALAQDGTRPYISAGWAPAVRDEGLTEGVVATAGVQIKPWIGVEGSVQLQREQSFPWKFSYQFATVTKELATDKDRPVVGYARFSPPCRGKICGEILLGMGFNRHYGGSSTTATCGSGQLPTPCVPLSEPRRSDTLTTNELVLASGFDLPIRVSPSVSVGPAVRVIYIDRRQFLTGYNHRGPSSGSGVVPSIGVSATWRSR